MQNITTMVNMTHSEVEAGRYLIPNAHEFTLMSVLLYNASLILWPTNIDKYNCFNDYLYCYTYHSIFHREPHRRIMGGEYYDQLPAVNMRIKMIEYCINDQNIIYVTQRIYTDKGKGYLILRNRSVRNQLRTSRSETYSLFLYEQYSTENFTLQ